ncbi:MAG: response regulator [Desulfuromonadales bacterium]|nr:response regulator [Desulfuromonadales bacterium]
MSAVSRVSKFHLSFRYKLLLIFTLLTAAASVAFSALYVINEIRESHHHVSEQLRLQAENLGDSVRLPLYAGNRDVLKQFAADTAQLPQIRSVIISAADGRVLAQFSNHSSGDSSALISETVTVRSSLQGISVESALGGGQEGVPVIIGSVRLERGTTDLSSLVQRTVMMTCCVALVFWLLVSGLCYLVLNKVTRSFNALMQGVERMQGGEFSTMIPVESNDEPGRAARAINELARTLAEREAENKHLNQQLLNAVEVEARTGAKLAATNASLRQEVAERTQAEQAVRNSEQYLRRLVDAMPVGVAWTSLDGRVEYVNDFIVERVGYGRDEFATSNQWYEKIFPDPQYREQIAELRREALSWAGRDAEIPTYEARVTCKDGAVRHVLFKHQYSQDRNLAIFVDITERELFQEQLIKTQKLESLGVLAGGIAHNFNNVLTGVMGYISFARMFLDESHKSHAALGHAENASRRAADMASQLLTFARGGAPVKRPVAVARLVQESLAISLNGTNTRSVVDIPESVHAIIGDEGQLSQAFNNIIINASQAMPEGGTITVRAENTSMAVGKSTGVSPSDFVKLSFSDQGEGIPESILHKVFDPYFTTKSTGTGLGLASVHSIIRKHGGVVTVDSELGKGTTFTLCLPSTGMAMAESDDIVRKLAPGGQGSGRILVMDDEEVIREFARESLEFLGYEVNVCTHGEEAVELYRIAWETGKPFFAALLDLTIPDGMGGAEAAKRILEFDASAKLIVSSGYSYDPIMAGYRQYGFCAAVSKPYKVDQLCRELSSLQNGPNGSNMVCEQLV